MNVRRIIVQTVFAVCIASPAHAQMAVIDSANLLQAVKEVSSEAQQVTQLEQQLVAQENMIKDLPGTIAPGLVSLAQQTQTLMQQVNTIQNMGTSLTAQMNSLYPSDYSTESFANIVNQIAAMQTAQRSAYQTSVAMQSQVAANQASISQAYKKADAESMSATGPTQAAQANTQALEAVGQQLGDMQSLMVAQENAEAQKATADESTDAAADAAQKQIWKYTPAAPVSIPAPFSAAGE